MSGTVVLSNSNNLDQDISSDISWSEVATVTLCTLCSPVRAIGIHLDFHDSFHHAKLKNHSWPTKPEMKIARHDGLQSIVHADRAWISLQCHFWPSVSFFSGQVQNANLRHFCFMRSIQVSAKTSLFTCETIKYRDEANMEFTKYLSCDKRRTMWSNSRKYIVRSTPKILPYIYVYLYIYAHIYIYLLWSFAIFYFILWFEILGGVLDRNPNGPPRLSLLSSLSGRCMLWLLNGTLCLLMSQHGF